MSAQRIDERIHRLSHSLRQFVNWRLIELIDNRGAFSYAHDFKDDLLIVRLECYRNDISISVGASADDLNDVSLIIALLCGTELIRRDTVEEQLRFLQDNWETIRALFSDGLVKETTSRINRLGLERFRQLFPNVEIPSQLERKYGEHF